MLLPMLLTGMVIYLSVKVDEDHKWECGLLKESNGPPCPEWTGHLQMSLEPSSNHGVAALSESLCSAWLVVGSCLHFTDVMVPVAREQSKITSDVFELFYVVLHCCVCYLHIISNVARNAFLLGLPEGLPD